MTRASVSAPGKLILMGEHAAVYGRPALVTAIDLRVRAEVWVRPGEHVRIASTRPGQGESASWQIVRDEARRARDAWWRWNKAPNTEWEAPSNLAWIALGEAVDHAAVERPPGLDIWIESDLPIGSGFGSSAAVGLAIGCAVLRVLDNEPDEAALRELSLEIERRQHGTPSGVDTEAVLRGGLLWCSRDGEGTLRCENVPLRSAALLGNLRIFQSGAPAETTGDVVSYVRRGMDDAPPRVGGVLDEIADASRLVRAEIERENGDPAVVCEQMRRCESCLEMLGVVPADVRETIRRVEAEGGGAKISGAGALSGSGAGSVLVYHPEPERIDGWDFLSRWSPLPLRLAADGLRVEVTA